LSDGEAKATREAGGGGVIDRQFAGMRETAKQRAVQGLRMGSGMQRSGPWDPEGKPSMWRRRRQLEMRKGLARGGAGGAEYGRRGEKTAGVVKTTRKHGGWMQDMHYVKEGKGAKGGKWNYGSQGTSRKKSTKEGL